MNELIDGLYNGKYIIACYNIFGELIDVADTPTEIKVYKTTSIQSICSHILKGKLKCSFVKLIDVTQIQNDVFAEEDKIFLDFIKTTRKKTIKERSRELGISEQKLRNYKKNLIKVQ